MKILVIDDEIDLKDVYLGFLSKIDATAKFCDHPQKGWLAIDKEQFDLIITDLKMPVISGEELISIVRSSKLNSHTPIILCSAHINKLVMTEMSRESKIYFLPKPFDSHSLLDLVNKAVSLKVRATNEDQDMHTSWMNALTEGLSALFKQKLNSEKLVRFETWNYETITLNLVIAKEQELNVTLLMKLSTFLKVAGKIQGTQYKEVEDETLHVWQSLIDQIAKEKKRITFGKVIGQEFLTLPEQRDAFYHVLTPAGEILVYLN